MTSTYPNLLKNLAQSEKPTTDLPKVRLNNQHNLYIKLEDGRGNRRWHPIVEVYFDSNNRLLVRYRTRDKSESAQPYAYAVVGKLLPQRDNEEKEEIV